MEDEPRAASFIFLSTSGGEDETEMNEIKFSARLKKAAGLVGGQAELARKTEISVRSINAYCLGDSDPSRSRLVALAKATGVNLLWLATGEGPMAPGKDTVRQLEDPVINEVKLWLRDMTGQDPDYQTWFRVELARKFEDFKEWREKKRATDTMENTGTG